jgi:hypothetical protein
MLRLLPPLRWTGLIAYPGGSQWGGAHTSAWIIPLRRAASFHDALPDSAAAGVMLLVLAALGQRRTTS